MRGKERDRVRVRQKGKEIKKRVDWLERFVFAKKVESDFLFKNIKTHTQMSFIAVLFIKIRSHQAGHLVFMYDDDDDNDESSENG